MPLLFVGIDEKSGQQGSPTIWVDTDKHELVIQGWKADAALEALCAATEVPGHAPGIPPHEGVVRIPARMVALVRKACDAAERAELPDSA